MLAFYFVVYNALRFKIVDIFESDSFLNSPVDISQIEFTVKFFNRCYNFVLYFAFAFDVFRTIVRFFDLNF